MSREMQGELTIHTKTGDDGKVWYAFTEGKKIVSLSELIAKERINAVEEYKLRGGNNE